LRSIAGIIPCEGNISFVDGIALHKHPVEFRKRVNYSEAEPLFPGFLTARDLFSFVGKARNATKDQQNYYQKAFGIDEYEFQTCETYSSGMLKKLSLALAFLGKPSVLILDEPLITLDTKAKTTLCGLIESHISDHQTTFLISSHQLLEETKLTVRTGFVIEDKTFKELRA
jgi:ABC-2 type transport system ATP-binding protein